MHTHVWTLPFVCVFVCAQCLCVCTEPIFVCICVCTASLCVCTCGDLNLFVCVCLFVREQYFALFDWFNLLDPLLPTLFSLWNLVLRAAFSLDVYAIKGLGIQIMCVCSFVCAFVCVDLIVYACTRVHSSICVRIRVCTVFVCMHLRCSERIFVCICVCTCGVLNLFVCVCVYLCVSNIFALFGWFNLLDPLSPTLSSLCIHLCPLNPSYVLSFVRPGAR